MPEPKTSSHPSALSVNEGVDQPSPISASIAGHLKKQRTKVHSAETYFAGIISGDRSLLSQAITLVESARPEHQETARELIALCLPRSGNSIRIGITGVPGAGKSTFIETFGLNILSIGQRVAVLAVDPSSARSKGSILGDKTRMEALSQHPDAFIRPSPSSGSLGGVSRKTRESIILCEAAGFDVILVETVGVGQSETTVKSMVDFFLLIMLAGAGDELQGIKRGIIEMADAIVINKADGDNIPRVNIAMAELSSALHYLHPGESGWNPVVSSCSAIQNQGVSETWETILKFQEMMKSSGAFQKNRIRQSLDFLHQCIEYSLVDSFYRHPGMKKLISHFEKEIESNTISAYQAALKLMEQYFQMEHQPQ